MKQTPEWIALRIARTTATKLARSRSLGERLAHFTERTDTCWLWKGVKNRGGYGQMCDRRGPRLIVPVHRVAWTLARGPIPPGLMVLHHCDVRHCVNPDHLYLGTARDNVHDAINRGRLVLTRDERGCFAFSKSV